MRNGIVLFTSDRGITPAALAVAAEERGFDTFYVPEHTHIPVKRDAAHPGTGDESLPDDRYLRTLDPWVSLATAAAGDLADPAVDGGRAAGRVRPDHAGQADRHARPPLRRPGRRSAPASAGTPTSSPTTTCRPAKRRTVLQEYVEAMRALWTQEEASYDGEFVSFGPSWAYPKPARRTSR